MKISKNISQLEPFIGTWLIHGENLPDNPRAPDSAVTGEWKVDVMAGGKFLESQWSYNIESGIHIGISILGAPNNESKLKMFNFDNGGFYRAYDLEIDPRKWTITGTKERATIEFDEQYLSYQEYWEILLKGEWKPLCRRTGTKQL